MYDEITLEMAIIERLALDAVRRKIASQQLGEAWVGLLHDPANDSEPVAFAEPVFPHSSPSR